jgi:hypothetical protein
LVVGRAEVIAASSTPGIAFMRRSNSRAPAHGAYPAKSQCLQEE